MIHMVDCNDIVLCFSLGLELFLMYFTQQLDCCWNLINTVYLIFFQTYNILVLFVSKVDLFDKRMKWREVNMAYEDEDGKNIYNDSLTLKQQLLITIQLIKYYGNTCTWNKGKTLNKSQVDNFIVQ